MIPVLEVNNLYESIKSAKLDPEVGIRLIHLAGGEQFSLFGAEIAPHKAVGAHYHKSGEEIYQIAEGSGVMHIGKPDSVGNVKWEQPFGISKGDCFTVNEGRVHQLYNDSDEKLVAIFGCSASHLSTDRIIVKGYNEK